MSKTTVLLSAVLMCLLFVLTPSLRAQGTARPDFTGVYSPVDPFGQAGRGRAAVPPPAAGTRAGALPPPRPVLVLDGRAGRPENAPKLTPEYLAKWEVIRKSRMAGSSEFDPNARCLSGGMPNMMSMTYGMEDSAHQRPDHHLRRAERRVSPDLSGRPQAVTASARRSDVRRVFHRALGRGHARRGHGGDSRGRAVRHVLAAQRSVHRARAHQVHVAGRPRESNHVAWIRKRWSNPSHRFVRIGRRRRRTTSCASSRVRRDWRPRSNRRRRYRSD